ncbi:penicillin-binding protein [Salsuginibacillus halophilus]|uniref:Penicillin-binding protein n=1 Tax=Salsuginibacillus halophilus TaxID=517424 RepID=A0A2P8HE98_9BACI|nr:transglycosylase domain-containing protein [Salsuginibacillus halophilus]PSL44557.1 penicillin-binding protein [Salsuginibacillus halophilus]
MGTFFQKFNETVGKWGENRVVRSLNITSQVFWNLILLFVILIIMAVLFVGGAGAGYFLSLVEEEEAHGSDEMREEIYNFEEISEVYFANDEYLGELRTDLERREIPLEDVSDEVIDAVLATEDEYFFEHDGIVPKALFRATYQEFSSTGDQTGGSTLTQQLVKNQLLSNEVSFERKANEIVLAMRLENYMDKDEILEAYLNIVPFGRNASGENIAGIQAAAEGVFGVEVHELNIPQAAFLAGIPQSPFSHTPFYNNGEIKSEEEMQSGLNRMRTVLNRMKDNNVIDEEEHEEALAYDIRDSLTEAAPSAYEEYPYITYAAEREARNIIRDKMLEEDGIDLGELEGEELQETTLTYTQDAQTFLRQQGLKVRTTIDKNIYDAMQDAISDDSMFGPDKTIWDEENQEEHVYQEEVGASLIDNATGKVLGFVGGRDFERQQMNHASDSNRDVGSTSKPVISYAPAIERGAVHANSIVPDIPYYPEGSDQEITNFDNQHRGLITVRESLQESRNTPAVRSMMRLDLPEARQDMLNMGIWLEESRPYESDAIGSFGATPEALTSAYSTFANEGTHRDAYMIESIETRDGDTIYEHEPETNEVFSPQTSYVMTDMLRDVLQPGGTAAGMPGYLNHSSDWAGKTGTTGDYTDLWFVGYNPNVSLGVWLGYDSSQLGVDHGVNGWSQSQRTQRIWAEIINHASEVEYEQIITDETFTQPEGVVSQSICGLTDTLPSNRCSEAGFVHTDLMINEHIPTTTDDSLEDASYVTIGGTTYRALSETPAEFTQTGILLDDDEFDVDNINEYLPESITDNIVPDREAPTNGYAPGAVTGTSQSGSTLTWNQHPDNDIVGYRIYTESGVQVDSIIDSAETSYNVSAGQSHYVTAVDTLGRESASSSITDTPSEDDEDAGENEGESSSPETETPEETENDTGGSDGGSPGATEPGDGEGSNGASNGGSNGQETEEPQETPSEDPPAEEDPPPEEEPAEEEPVEEEPVEEEPAEEEPAEEEPVEEEPAEEGSGEENGED